MDEAFECDRLIMLHDGVIIAQGSPQELIALTSGGNLEAAFLEFEDREEAKKDIEDKEEAKQENANPAPTPKEALDEGGEGNA